jgi:hypothetical protein
MRLIIASGLVVLSTLGCFAQTPEHGRVTGTVLTQEGQPVKGASVCVVVWTNGSNATCRDTTDEEGRFDIKSTPMGNFHVTASKEEDGYSMGVEGQAGGQEVDLTAANPSADILIKLGTRAGILIGSVKDSVTGKPIDRIQLNYISTTGNGAGTALGYDNGAFRFNLPTTDDYIFLVSAPGYKTWFYRDADQDASLHLASGEQKNLDIYLVPKPDKGK